MHEKHAKTLSQSVKTDAIALQEHSSSVETEPRAPQEHSRSIEAEHMTGAEILPTVNPPDAEILPNVKSARC